MTRPIDDERSGLRAASVARHYFPGMRRNRTTWSVSQSVKNKQRESTHSLGSGALVAVWTPTRHELTVPLQTNRHASEESRTDIVMQAKTLQFTYIVFCRTGAASRSSERLQSTQHYMHQTHSTALHHTAMLTSSWSISQGAHGWSAVQYAVAPPWQSRLLEMYSFIWARSSKNRALVIQTPQRELPSTLPHLLPLRPKLPCIWPFRLWDTSCWIYLLLLCCTYNG